MPNTPHPGWGDYANLPTVKNWLMKGSRMQKIVGVIAAIVIIAGGCFMVFFRPHGTHVMVRADAARPLTATGVYCSGEMTMDVAALWSTTIRGCARVDGATLGDAATDIRATLSRRGDKITYANDDQDRGVVLLVYDHSARHKEAFNVCAKRQAICTDEINSLAQFAAKKTPSALLGAREWFAYWKGRSGNADVLLLLSRDKCVDQDREKFRLLTGERPDSIPPWKAAKLSNSVSGQRTDLCWIDFDEKRITVCEVWEANGRPQLQSGPLCSEVYRDEFMDAATFPHAEQGREAE